MPDTHLNDALRNPALHNIVRAPTPGTPSTPSTPSTRLAHAPSTVCLTSAILDVSQELFFDELIDNSHQATNGLPKRHVTFKFDMSKTQMNGYGISASSPTQPPASLTQPGKRFHDERSLTCGCACCVASCAGVEDNGRGQDKDGLKGMTTPGFHKSGGDKSEQIGFYGIGFNSAVSSVASKIRVESRTPGAPNVMTVLYNDLSENWTGKFEARKAQEPSDGPHFMKIICDDVRCLHLCGSLRRARAAAATAVAASSCALAPPLPTPCHHPYRIRCCRFRCHVIRRPLSPPTSQPPSRARWQVKKETFVEYYQKMKDGLHEHIANTYCLQLAPPSWANEVRASDGQLEKLEITINFKAPSTRIDPSTGVEYAEFDGYTGRDTVNIRTRHPFGPLCSTTPD